MWCQWDLVPYLRSGLGEAQGFPWSSGAWSRPSAGRDLNCVCACVLVSLQCSVTLVSGSWCRVAVPFSLNWGSNC